MQAFRDRKVRILVCTDVASRGLDVKDITHVINYSLPRELDSYVHRIGRTARSGKTGIAMNLVTLSHKHLIFQIERMTKVQMKEGVLPSRREIATKKVAKLLTGFQNQPFHERVLEVLGEEWKAQLATMTAEQVAAHFIAMLMSDVFNEKDKKLSDSRAPRVAEERAQRAPREFAPVPRSTVRIAAPRPSRSIQTPVIVAEKPRPVRAPVAVPAERPTRVPVAPVVSERPLRSQASAKPTPSVKKIDLDAPPTFGVRTTVGARKAKPFAKPVVRGAPAKPKANQPGPTKTARVEEIPLLNRRARRAEKFAKSAEQESRSK
jgi:superfamily II DNA/RNA helicase